jgi:glutaredoxin-like protein
MTVIADKDRDTVRDVLTRELVHGVELLFFTRPRSGPNGAEHEECQTCDETHELLAELVGLSDQLQLTICDVAADPDTATRYNVTAVPTVLLRRVRSSDSPNFSADDPAPNVRFLGLPSGYEFTTLLADIVDVSRGVTGLATTTLETVRAIDEPVHIQVFVTPACPYCPRAARLAHQMAMENRLIVADVIEANEFPALSQRYAVRSVPKTVINNRVEFVGSLPEPKVLEALAQALSHE